jgi:serine/threonine protein kinase
MTPPEISVKSKILASVLGTLGAVFFVGGIVAVCVMWKKQKRRQRDMTELAIVHDTDYQSVDSMSVSDSVEAPHAPVYGGPPLAVSKSSSSSSNIAKKDAHTPPVMRTGSSVRQRGTTAEVLDIPFDEMRLGRKLGEGAFGVVFKAKWHGNDIAVKQVKLRSMPGGRNMLAEFESEISQMAQTAFHENLVQLHGVTTLENGDMAAVVEYCAHGSLATALYGESARTDWTTKALFTIAHGAACGMAHLHRQGVVHRDIAARNVLLTKHDVPKVADFGMARLLDDAIYDEQQTLTTVGPLKWMAPEQMERRVYSKASDVFAFGVLLFEIFAREAPWTGVTNIMTATKVVIGERMDVSLPNIPASMGALMNRCWMAEPQERPVMEQVQNEIHMEKEVDDDEEEEGEEEEE